MTGQQANFKKWKHLLREAFGIDAGQTCCPNLYDILNSPKVEQILKRDKKDCPPLMVGNVDQAVLDKRWGIAYHKILGSSFWQNHAEATFAGEIQTALNDGKEILADPVREAAYSRSLGLTAPPVSPAPLNEGKEILADPVRSPDGVELIRQGVRLIEAGDYRAAIDRLDRAIQLQPNSCEAFASRAWAWYELAALPKARNDCDEAIRLDPDFAWVYVIRGKILNLSNQPEAAIKDLNTAVQKLNQQIARVKVQIKEAERAFDLSRAVELKDRKLADLIRKLKQAEAELVNITTSRATSSVIQNVVQISKTSLSDLYHSGTELSDQGKYEEAIAKFSELIRREPDWGKGAALSGRAIAYSKLHRYQEAISDCDKAVQVDANFALIYRIRGDAEYALGIYQSAISDYSEQIRLKPQEAYAYYKRGLSYQQIDQDKAISDFHTAEKLYREQDNSEMCQKAINQSNELLSQLRISRLNYRYGGVEQTALSTKLMNFCRDRPWMAMKIGIFLVPLLLLTLKPILNDLASALSSIQKLDCTLEKNRSYVDKETTRIWGSGDPERVGQDGNAIVPTDEAWGQIRNGVESRLCK